MNTQVAIRHNDRRLYAIIHRILLIGVLCFLIFLAGKILQAVTDGEIPGSKLFFQPVTFLSAATLYVIGHCFRSLRLALLIGGWRIGLRMIVSFHFMTAALSLAVPMKLGELYRLAELSKLLGSFMSAVETIWWERLFDVLAIVIIMIMVLGGVAKSDWPQFYGVGLLAIVFIAVTALAVFVLPDNLRRLSVLIIRRYDNRRSVPLLRHIDRIRRTILEAPHMVKGKIASLAALTVLIWASELSCLAIVLRALGNSLEAAPDALLSFLSILTSGYTLIGALNGEPAPAQQGVLLYLATTQIPLVFVGLLAALYYVRRQMKFGAPPPDTRVYRS
jgi:hypothetical protein